MNLITRPEEFDRLLEEAETIIFKHSTRCSISSSAHLQVEQFLAECPHRSLHKVHVIENRPLSIYIAERTGVHHASPQVIVLRQGRVHWHASHFEITMEALGKQSSEC